MADFPSASIIESTTFTAVVSMPAVARGLFRERRTAVRAATAGNTDGKAVSLLSSMSRRYDGRPVWVRSGIEDTLVLLAPEDIPRVLLAPVDEFTADTPTRRKGLVHYQPDGITLARGSHWHSRRAFTDALFWQANRITINIEEVAADEVARLLAEQKTIGWSAWQRMFARIARRVVLGDKAAGDWALTEALERMTSGANNLPGKRSGDLAAFQGRVAAYLRRRQENSLAGLLADAPIDALTKPAGQVAHWLNHLGEELAANTFRAAALQAVYPDVAARADADATSEWRRAILFEAMRLWPTTRIISRCAVKDVSWGNSIVMRKGVKVVIVNAYFQRDPERLTYADVFAPEEWITGTAATNPAMNFFGSGTQECPGRNLGTTIGAVVLRELSAAHSTLVSPKSFAQACARKRPLPHMFDYFTIQLGR